MEFKDLPPLEQPCDNCAATGQVERIINNGKRKRKTHETCGPCHGRATQLTEFGQAVLKLLTDYAPWQEDLQIVQNSLQDSIADARYSGPYGSYY